MTEDCSFEFIDIFEGLEHHRIRRTNLKFIGLDDGQFKSITSLQKDEFELEMKELQLMSEDEKLSATQLGYKSPNHLEPGHSTMEYFNDVRAVSSTLKTVSLDALKKTDLIRSMRFPSCETPKVQLAQDVSAFSLVSDDNIHPSSDPVQRPSSGFQEVQSEKSYKNIFSDHIDQNFTLESSLSKEFSVNGKIRPLSRASSDIQLSFQSKKIKASLHSDPFRPISSELHILTSDSCFDF